MLGLIAFRVGAPVNTIAGVLSGGTNFGSTLTCTSGTWTGQATITFTYQFKANGVNIGSPGGNTYVTTFSNAGKTITCVVIGTNAVGTVNGRTSNGIVVQSAALLAGYRVWYDPGQLTGKVDGDLISTLPDLAAVISADQTASGVGRPTYRTPALNGYAGLEFNGTANFTTGSALIFPNGANTVFCVIKSIPAPAVANYAMPFGTGGSGNGIHYCNSYTNLGVATVNCGIGSGPVCSVVITAGENIVLGMRYDAGNNLLRLNGSALRQSTTSINTGIAAGGSFGFGRDPLSANKWAAFTLMEFVSYASGLSSGDFAYNEAYLKAKYAL